MLLESLNVSPSNIDDLLSAIEADLRTLIINYLSENRKASEILGEVLLTKCLDRQIKERGVSNDLIQDLLFYTDFADAFHIINANRQFLPDPLARYLKTITMSLEKLVPIRNRVAHHRPLFYDDCSQVEDFTLFALKSHTGIWNGLLSVVSDIVKQQDTKETRNMHNLPLPDYEETGFIGRKKQVEQLKKICLQSPYPVITVIGDGGVGKSAIALKAAYDIVNSSDCPFDSVVWTTSKTTQLTPQEIKNIKNSIHSSIEMLQDISDFLGPKGNEDPLEEVLAYLSTFKILLILDNLETILDDQIRQFLGNLPSGGSKVLITSRIGVGAYEVPFQLQPLDEGEAIQLLRSLADIRQVTKLVQMPSKQLGNFCKKMKNSPLFIKWFVSALQTGIRPEEILEKRDLFLEFCMSNVYDYLSNESQRVLSSMLSIPGRHSQAELAFLNDMDAIELEGVIRQLRTTTMISIASNAKYSSFESKYELSDLARDYLSKHHPVRSDEERFFKRRRQQLTAAIEQLKAEEEQDPYSFYSISRRSQSDVIVAVYLREALLKAKDGNFKDADIFVGKARRLAPEYFEVYRVEATIKAKQKNNTAARTAYEAAIELNPHSAPLRYWYAGFLLRYQDELEDAHKEYKEAAKIDPNSIEIQMELARTCLFLRRFDEARTVIDNILENHSQMKAFMRRKISDLNLQYYARKAEHLIEQRDKFGAFTELEYLKETYLSYPSDLIDQRIKKTVIKCERSIRTCANAMQQDEKGIDRATRLVEWFEAISGPIDIKLEALGNVEGKITKHYPLNNFSFILTGDGREFFLHRDNMVRISDWSKLSEGTVVRFFDGGITTGPTPVALKAQIIEPSNQPLK